MSEKPKLWLWDRLRKRSRKELDRIEENLVKGSREEKRQFAGDPNQSRQIWVRTRNK
ncbi:MAG TPA: hypothetical protein VFU47_06295 [Armatimonadota bacterium]|nr:hypothetical protein [Armatimonadota bacterium]